MKTDSGLLYQYSQSVNNDLYIVLQMKVFQRQEVVEDTRAMGCLLMSFFITVNFPVLLLSLLWVIGRPKLSFFFFPFHFTNCVPKETFFWVTVIGKKILKAFSL